MHVSQWSFLFKVLALTTAVGPRKNAQQASSIGSRLFCLQSQSFWYKFKLRLSRFFRFEFRIRFYVLLFSHGRWFVYNGESTLGSIVDASNLGLMNKMGDGSDAENTILVSPLSAPLKSKTRRLRTIEVQV
ncbi:hypothetical protein NE237_002580 [Protea cynaroides]|uniref:Uncharacterized protein n=1 Tax=Protea cynaroides TaxID=273540 RepID=A0A9Q0QZI2_9MAGN|nr:hypothetical protein NE237_002580 [Protea cynaroides]